MRGEHLTSKPREPRSTPYGSFPMYAKNLNVALTQFSSDDCSLKKGECSVFKDFKAVGQDMTQFINSDECLQGISLSTFKSISEKCSGVLELHLHDFLDGGIFEGKIDHDVR